MAVEKKDLDWSNLSFKYQPCDYSYVCNYHDGAWEEGGLTSEHTITLSEDAGIYQYCQEIFEGMKAYTTEDGSIVVFRPDLNAKRMADSARRMVMPPFPEDKFVDAVKQVVTANEAWVPPFGSGATLYIRPFMIATGEVLGLGASDKYQFRIFVSPVGPYFKAGAKAVKLTIPAYDRAAPMGTGNIKAGLNYGMSLYPTLQAHLRRGNRRHQRVVRRQERWPRGSRVGDRLHPALHHAPLARGAGAAPGHPRGGAPGALRRGACRRLRRVRLHRHRGRHLSRGQGRGRGRRRDLP